MPVYSKTKLPDDAIFDPCDLEQGLLKRYSRLFLNIFFSGLVLFIPLFAIMWVLSTREEDRAFLIWVIPVMAVVMPSVVVPLAFLLAIYCNSFLIFRVGENELTVTDVLRGSIKKIGYGKITEVRIRAYRRPFWLRNDNFGHQRNRSVMVKYSGGEINSEWVLDAEKTPIDGFISRLKEKLGEGKILILNE
jgi:hypothetical protein